MLQHILAAILTLASLAPAVAAQTPAPAAAVTQAQPKAVVAQPIHDFKEIEKTAKVSHEFVIRNDGTAPLLLREARPDCACAVASFDATIAPGATGKVRVELDPADQLGPIRKQVLVFTNDPAAPELQLTLTAIVRPQLLIKPGYARYIYVQKEAPGTISQTIWSADGRDFKVLAVNSPYPHLKATFHEAKAEERLADKPGKQWRVTTTLDPNSPVGALVEPVVIVTDHPLQKELTLEVSGFVRPVVAVTPPAGDFRNLKSGVEHKGSVVVKTFATEAIAVTGAEIDLPGATATVETVAEGRHYLVRVTLPATLAKGPFTGVLRIKTASPKAPSVEVPLQGVVVSE